jgi:putative acetyltransferase
MIVRLEAPGNVVAIRVVEEEAFGRSAEAQLVDDLRAAGDSVFSLVAVDDETVVGHALFSRMKAPFPALALGPVAVLPEYRRTGLAAG